LDEVTLRRAVAKGEQTQKMIEAQRQIWAEIEVDLWRMWVNSKSDDMDGREALYREHHAIKAVQSRLKRIVTEGKKAEEELKQQKVKDGK
jgi:hypothetical protein